MTAPIAAVAAAAVTLFAFVAARRLARALGAPPWASPVLIAALAVTAGLAVTPGIAARDYGIAVAPLTWWLKPAVVALGALLWDARRALSAGAAPLAAAVVTGVATGVGSAVALARLTGLPAGIAAAFTTRTVTTPFAVAIQAHVGGPVALAAAFAVLGGVAGTMIVPPLLRALRIDGDAAAGTAIGVSSHLVGTDWLVRRRPAAAPFAGAAMVLAGVIAAVALPPLWPWLMALLP